MFLCGAAATGTPATPPAGTPATGTAAAGAAGTTSTCAPARAGPPTSRARARRGSLPNFFISPFPLLRKPGAKVRPIRGTARPGDSSEHDLRKKRIALDHFRRKEAGTLRIVVIMLVVPRIPGGDRSRASSKTEICVTSVIF